MQAGLLAVLLDSVKGRESELSDYYTNVHIRDVMRLPGSVAVQRFEHNCAEPGVGSNPHRFFAIYEISDRKACSKGHYGDIFTLRMPISPDADFDRLQDGYYDVVCGSRSSAYGEGIDGPVIVVRLNAKLGEGDSFEQYWSGSIVDMSSLPGVIGGQLFRVTKPEEQMFDLPMTHRYLALFRVNDEHIAMVAWRKHQSIQEQTDNTTDWESVIVASYTPLFPRLQAADVIHPSVRAATEEKRARLAVGEGIAVTLPLPPKITSS